MKLLINKDLRLASDIPFPTNSNTHPRVAFCLKNHEDINYKDVIWGNFDLGSLFLAESIHNCWVDVR